jgi:hypothetical protein
MAIKTTAIHLLPDDVYLVKHPTYCKIIVNGIEVPKNNYNFVVKTLDEIEAEINLPGKLISFKNSSNETFISPKEYEERLYNLRSKGYLDDYDDIIFDDIDNEYAYKKFLKEWTPVYGESQIFREPLEIEITEIRTESGDPDIVSLWNSSRLKEQGLYNLNREEVSKKILATLCQERDLKLEIPSHGGLKYVKINNSYAFTDCAASLFSGQFTGSLEKAKKEKQALVDRITTIVNLHSAKRDNKEFFNQADILIELKKLLEPKNIKLTSLLNQLSQIISKLEKNLNDSY